MAKEMMKFETQDVNLIKDTFGRGLTDTEFSLFLHTAKAVGLNPLKRQIYAIKRKQWNDQKKGYDEHMTIQTGIDGFRAVTARNRSAIPGRDPEFVTEERKISKSNPAGLISAKAFLLVWGKDEHYHEATAVAYWDEYVPLRQDGTPQAMWKKMPRTMLAKCAEALLHRKLNPEDLSGIYTTEEMQQADADKKIVEGVHHEPEPTPALPEEVEVNPDVVVDVPSGPFEKDEKVTLEQVKEIFPEAQEITPERVKEPPRRGKFGFLDEAKKMKEDLGEDGYYAILRSAGYQHANQVEKRKDQIEIWKAWRLAVDLKKGDGNESS